MSGPVLNPKFSKICLVRKKKADSRKNVHLKSEVIPHCNSIKILNINIKIIFNTNILREIVDILLIDLENSFFSAKLQNENLKKLIKSLNEYDFEKNYKILMTKIKKIENLIDLIKSNRPSQLQNDIFSVIISKIKKKLTLDKKNDVEELFEKADNRFYLLKNSLKNSICPSFNVF